MAFHRSGLIAVAALVSIATCRAFTVAPLKSAYRRSSSCPLAAAADEDSLLETSTTSPPGDDSGFDQAMALLEDESMDFMQLLEEDGLFHPDEDEDDGGSTFGVPDSVVKNGLLDDDMPDLTVAVAVQEEEEDEPIGGVDTLISLPPGTLKPKQVDLLLNSLRKAVVDTSTSPQDTTLLESSLYRLLDEYGASVAAKDKGRMKLLEPTLQDFSIVVDAFEQISVRMEKDVKRNYQLATRVLGWYQELFDLAESGIVASIKPTPKMIEQILLILSRDNYRGIDEQARNLVTDLPLVGVEETAGIYSLLILIIAKSRAPDAAKRADELIRYAVDEYPPDADGDGGISLDSFNAVLTAWAKSPEPELGVDKAQDLLLKMEDAGTTPNIQSYTSLIDAHAQQHTYAGAMAAERTLNAVLDTYLKEESGGVAPTLATWGIVMSAWTRLSRKGSRDAASQADNLLKRMLKLHESGRLEYGPDAVAYRGVALAWAACKADVDAPKKAQAILEEMNERYMDGDDSYHPSTKLIKEVIDAWIKSEKPEALFEAEKILDQYDGQELLVVDDNDMNNKKEIMEEIFRAFVCGWAKNQDPDRAQEYLEDMVERDLRPNPFCFDKVIESYTKLIDNEAPVDDEESPRNVMTKIHQVLDLVTECTEKGMLKPTEHVYTTYIRSLARAKVVDLPTRAVETLDRMKNKYADGNKWINPTTFTYNAVLNACAEARTEDEATNLEAFIVALKIFNELRAHSSERPDHVTFGNVLQCSALLPQGRQREALVKSTFQFCAKSGFVNSLVVRDLQNAATEGLWRELTNTPEGDVAIERFPAEWTRRFDRKDEEKRGRQHGGRGPPGGRGGRPGGQGGRGRPPQRRGGGRPQGRGGGRPQQGGRGGRR